MSTRSMKIASKVLFCMSLVAAGVLLSTPSQASSEAFSSAAIPVEGSVVVKTDCLDTRSEDDVRLCVVEDSPVEQAYSCDGVWGGKPACFCRGAGDCIDMLTSGDCAGGTFRCGTKGCVCQLNLD